MGLLVQSCGFTATASNGTLSIFNTSNIQGQGSEFDPDLGSPNRNCNPSGPGIGAGGIPSSNYSNCEPQGNALIIQDPRYNRPNDNAGGGCIVFDFLGKNIELINMKMLDVEEPNVNITVRIMCMLCIAIIIIPISPFLCK
jgi:hypothetical protein